MSMQRVQMQLGTPVKRLLRAVVENFFGCLWKAKEILNRRKRIASVVQVRVRDLQMSVRQSQDGLLKSAKAGVHKGQFGFFWDSEPMFVLEFCQKLRKGLEVSHTADCFR